MNYLLHRWIGVALALLMVSWFVSGIALMYYPWPAPTASHQLAWLAPFAPSAHLVGYPMALREAARLTTGAGGGGPPVGGRLVRWGGGGGERLVYQLWCDRKGRTEPCAIVDAFTGTLLAPVPAADAVRAARVVVGAEPPVRAVDLLLRGDHYMMAGEYAGGFPAYRVRFADPAATAVYVARASGAIFGVVTARTRVTTWIGTVPHWLYFQWLYERPGLWTWTNLILPSAGVLLAITGIVLGLRQLFPRRRRADWRVSGYRGVSKIHHVTGAVFGVIVLTWTASGVLEVLGESNEPRAGQAARVRGDPDWTRVRVSEAQAATPLPGGSGGWADPGGAAWVPVAIDLAVVGGAPGYAVHLASGGTYWVDAETGARRGELDAAQAAAVAQRALGGAVGVRSVDRITAYDTYYYARHGREMPLPAWRVALADRAHSVVYLDPVTGAPVGFVDTDSRSWRWLRDGLHTFDFPGLNNRRPLWDLVVLPLMLGGTLGALTGLWIAGRRLRRTM